jgi:hypothetical protein
MAINGNLRTMPFPDLLQWIAMSKKTGTLVIKGQGITKKILFRDGTVSAVTSDNPREHLGYYLVGWGYLTEAELQDLLDRQRDARVMLGELLVQLGRMSREEVTRLVKIKTEQTIYDLILWDEGEFFFLDENQPRRDFQELNLPVDHFIFEGTRQADERRRIAEHIPDANHVPKVARKLNEAKLPPVAQAVLREIDGHKSITEIALRCRLPEFEILNFVYQGLRSQVFELLPPQGEAAPLPGFAISSWRDVLREAENSLELGDLLEAYRSVCALREKHADVLEARRAAGGVQVEIESELAKQRYPANAVPELALTLADVTRLKCGPDEAFVLSRINGIYTMTQVLSQLPGDKLYNQLVIFSLIQRGVVKLRESQAVTSYRPK